MIGLIMSAETNWNSCQWEVIFFIIFMTNICLEGTKAKWSDKGCDICFSTFDKQKNLLSLQNKFVFMNIFVMRGEVKKSDFGCDLSFLNFGCDLCLCQTE